MAASTSLLPLRSPLFAAASPLPQLELPSPSLFAPPAAISPLLPAADGAQSAQQQPPSPLLLSSSSSSLSLPSSSSLSLSADEDDDDAQADAWSAQPDGAQPSSTQGRGGGAGGGGQAGAAKSQAATGSSGSTRLPDRRVSIACSNCSLSKTKCDNFRPCGRCSRTDRSATCADMVRRRRRRGRKRPLDADAGDADLSGLRPTAALSATTLVSVSPESQQQPVTACMLLDQPPVMPAAVVLRAGEQSQQPCSYSPRCSWHGPAAPMHSQSLPQLPLQPQPQPPRATHPPLPIVTVLSRLRARLPSSLFRSFDAVVQQLHSWADALSAGSQQQPQPHQQHSRQQIIAARIFLCRMLTDAMRALEAPGGLQALQQKQHYSSSSSSTLALSGSVEQELLLHRVSRDWGAQLYGPRLGSTREEAEGEEEQQEADEAEAASLDVLLQHRVATPTFIIPLSSLSALTSPPLFSASFASLLGFSACELSRLLQSPLSLLQLRQCGDIAPLVPAFFAAVSARADHYLHSSGWQTASGHYLQLISRVQILYDQHETGGASPVALMAQLKRAGGAAQAGGDGQLALRLQDDDWAGFMQPSGV